MRYFVTLCLIVLAGCATRPQPTRVDLPPMPPGAATRSVVPDVPSDHGYKLAWDYSNGLANISTFRMYADGPSQTNWDTGKVLTYTPPLPPGLWNLTVRAVGSNGVESLDSNTLTLRVVPSQVISYAVQWAATLEGPRTNLVTINLTNLPPNGFLFGEGRIVQ